MNRRGISLLEVLFAIGVIAIGLLGVTSVMPVALNQMGHGNIADRSYRVGQDAIHDVHVRHINNYNQWVWLNRNFAPPNYVNNQPRIEVVGQPPAVSWYTGPLPAAEKFPVDKYRGYVVDPMFIAANGFMPSAAGSPNLFPYDTAPGGPRMERVSLVMNTGSPARTVPPPVYPASTYPIFPQVLTRPAADLVFLHDDDLTFDIPKDKSLPPTQQYPSLARREFEGHFSWVATFAPTLDATDAPRDCYSMSIVVFHRRDLSMSMNAVNERVVSVAAFNNGGFSGGDVTLSAGTAAELEIRSGNWLMLMGTLPTASSGSSMGVFRWYRVVETESEPLDISGAGTSWTREVTLQGADWPTSLTTAPGLTQAAIVDRVVAVYERTIEVSDANITQ